MSWIAELAVIQTWLIMLHGTASNRDELVHLLLTHIGPLMSSTNDTLL